MEDKFKNKHLYKNYLCKNYIDPNEIGFNFMKAAPAEIQNLIPSEYGKDLYIIIKSQNNYGKIKKEI